VAIPASFFPLAIWQLLAIFSKDPYPTSPQLDSSQCFFSQICEVGLLATNCQCLYARVAIFFGVGGSSWLQRKYFSSDVAMIICVCS
jgi:hypothetical protein